MSPEEGSNVGPPRCTVRHGIPSTWEAVRFLDRVEWRAQAILLVLLLMPLEIAQVRVDADQHLGDPSLARRAPALLAPHDPVLAGACAQRFDFEHRVVPAGELLDLELDCVVNFGNHGTWLKVPLGKLGTERMVPLDASALAVIDAWIGARGEQRALPHPRTGRPTDFVFMERGRRISAFRLTKGLDMAAAAAGLTRPDGAPVHLTPHVLRHTFGTSLINAGISLPALMSLMGHVKPEMTLRYARLASPTVRMAYDAAMGKVQARAALGVIPAGRTTAVPSRVDWLHSEMLKTRVAHGYCARELVAGACPYANICEQCDNYVPAAEFASVLEGQLGDVRLLKADAEARGWDSEADRHGRVLTALKEHLRRLDVAPSEEASV